MRGNHECRSVSGHFGFKEECVTRCAEGLVVWQQVNALFEMMPVAALVDGAVLCLHGGLGLSLHSLDQLKGLPRPAKLLRPAAIELPRGVRVVAAAAACAFTALEVEADHRSPRREGPASACAERRESVWCAGDASKFCIPGTLEAVGGVHFLPSCYVEDASTHELSAS